MPFDAAPDISPETEALVLDLLEWIAKAPQPYTAVMEAWRTSCPRLPVWETACDRHYVERAAGAVRVTAAGRAHLAAQGR